MQTFSGSDLLWEATDKYGIHLSVLVAETSLWAHPHVHQYLVRQHNGAALYPNKRRYRAGQEKVRDIINGIQLDDNSYANLAIKRALGLSREQVTAFETCHIWPLTCYDERYHTAIANLVLIPSAIASLSDHDQEVQAALQYRAFELYQWHPVEVLAPQKPAFYPSNWRQPFAFPTRLFKISMNALPSSATGQARDFTKYLFQSTIYGKNRLVHAVIAAYVAQNPAISFNQLRMIFPDSLQGSHGVIRELNFVSANANLTRRYFTKSHEHLHIQNGQEVIVVCSQWGIFNVNQFIQTAKKLGFEITLVNQEYDNP